MLLCTHAEPCCLAMTCSRILDLTVNILGLHKLHHIGIRQINKNLIHKKTKKNVVIIWHGEIERGALRSPIRVSSLYLEIYCK